MPSLFYQFIPMVSTMVSIFFHIEYKLGMKLCVTITHLSGVFDIKHKWDILRT